MERKRIVLLAAGVMLAGVLAALPFRRPPDDSRAPATAPAVEGPILAPAQPVVKNAPPAASPDEPASASVDAPSPSLEVQGASESASPPPAPVSEASSQASSASSVSSGASTPLPTEPNSLTPGAIATIDEPPAGTIAAVTPLPSSAPPADSTPSDAPMRPQSWRRHRIQDGDTLAKLAQKYLGDPARESEIFALNRNVLSDPALLPIGVWLKVPYADSRN